MHTYRAFIFGLFLFVLFLECADISYASKVWEWDLEGQLLHPRSYSGKLYVSEVEKGYLYKKVNESVFLRWDIGKVLGKGLNGIAPSSQGIYGVYNVGPPFLLDENENKVYVWDYKGLELYHAFYDGNKALFAGHYNSRGVIAVIEDKYLSIIDFSNYGITDVKDVVSVYDGGENIVVFSFRRGLDKGGVGFLYYDNLSFTLWFLPDIFGGMVDPNGISLGKNNSDVLVAILDAHSNTSFVRFNEARFYVFPYEEFQLHVKPFGSFYLVSLRNGRVALTAFSHSAYVFEANRITGTAKKETLGEPIREEKVEFKEVHISPRVVDLTKQEHPTMGYIFNTVGVHDFYEGYAAGSKLYYLKELVPRLYLYYEQGTIRSWIEPAYVFTQPLVLYINNQPVAYSNNISLPALFTKGMYNVSVYYLEDRRFMNWTLVRGSEAPHTEEVKIYSTDKGDILYAKTNLAGGNIEIKGKYYWSDHEGEVILPLTREDVDKFKSREPLFLVLAMLFFTAFLFLVLFGFRKKRIKNKNKKYYLVLWYGLSSLFLIASVLFGYLYLTSSIEVYSLPPGNTTSELILITPSGMPISNISVYINGVYVGTTDVKGRINFSLSKGVYNVSFEMKYDGKNMSTLLGVVKSKSYIVPLSGSPILRRGKGINGWSITQPVPFASYDLPQEVCDVCALKAYMVGTVQAERCRLCSLQEKTLLYASMFSIEFSIVRSIIDSCSLPLLPPPLTPSLKHAVATPQGVNYVYDSNVGGADDLIKDIIKSYFPNIPCKDIILSFDGSLGTCDVVSCVEDLTPLNLPFSCGCYYTCAIEAPTKIIDTYFDCIEDELLK